MYTAVGGPSTGASAWRSDRKLRMLASRPRFLADDVLKSIAVPHFVSNQGADCSGLYRTTSATSATSATTSRPVFGGAQDNDVFGNGRVRAPRRRTARVGQSQPHPSRVDLTAAASRTSRSSTPPPRGCSFAADPVVGHRVDRFDRLQSGVVVDQRYHPSTPIALRRSTVVSRAGA